ncbi:hypothetical protein M8J75_001868 [Diaphorina citri]|nr:hypothetical protein M8J75_001868 [Diaphorina citri]
MARTQGHNQAKGIERHGTAIERYRTTKGSRDKRAVRNNHEQSQHSEQSAQANNSFRVRFGKKFLHQTVRPNPSED